MENYTNYILKNVKNHMNGTSICKVLKTMELTRLSQYRSSSFRKNNTTSKKPVYKYHKNQYDAEMHRMNQANRKIVGEYIYIYIYSPTVAGGILVYCKKQGKFGRE